MKKRLLLGICLSTTFLVSYAQDCHLILHGQIIDSETKEPLAFASVYVEEVQKGAYTDENGNYLIEGLCEKTPYTVRLSHIDCGHQLNRVELTENSQFNFVLQHHEGHLGEVVIVQKAVEAPKIQAANTIQGLAFENVQAQGFGASVRDLPGVTLLKTGATISKPVIQGLSGNRIAILTNGVVLEGQQWGTEHAPEVDPFSAGKITVVKGANAVRYGTSAIGGAILVDQAALRDSIGLGGWAALSSQSNGRGGAAALAFDWKPSEKKAAFRLQGSFKRHGNLQAPDYFLENTGTSEANFSFLSQFSKKKWNFEAFVSQFNQKLAVLRASHTGNIQDLENAIAAERPLNNEDVFSYALGRPRQQVQHSLVKLQAKRSLSDLWKLRTIYAFQYNYRAEYDAHKAFGGTPQDEKPQIEFYNYTNTIEAAVSHAAVRHWSGEVGAQGQWQYNQTGTGGFVPDHLSLSASAWAMERWRRYPHPFEYEGGLRADFKQIHVTDSLRAVKLDTSLVFGNISAVGGILWRFAPDFSLQAHSALAWRPPYPTELFAAGVHHGAAIYEQGNATMTSEKAWNNSLSLEKTGKNWQASLTIYQNWIRDFIYLEPENDFVVTIRGVFPKYRYQQADALLRGFDGQVLVSIVRGFSLETKASILRAGRISKAIEPKKEWLPLMPSDRVWYALIWENAKQTRIKMGANTVFQQSRIPEIGLLKAAPERYTLFFLEFNFQTKLAKKPLEIGFRIDNLSNKRYRDYMDFFRYFVDAPGLDASLRVKWRF